jgi:S1-C subfamily serine protease
MGDGRRVTCHLVGTDAATDIGLVKMDTKPQDVATLGSSTQLKVGQLAIAIGSPLALSGGHSVTSGIISAVDRQVPSGNGPPLLDMIATDATIEPGSSGGALVDASGMVVGITTAIALGEQGLQTFGFATPIEVAKDVANQLLSTGKVTHAWLGIQGTDIDPATAGVLGVTGGAVVQIVDSHSPAGRAGVATADVITGFDGQTIASMSSLAMDLSRRRPGDRVGLTYIHDGETHNADVVLLARPSS